MMRKRKRKRKRKLANDLFFFIIKMATAKQLAALKKGREKLKRLRAQGKAKRGRKKKPTKRKLMKQLREL